MTKVYFATGNAHKAKELISIMDAAAGAGNILVKLPSDAGIAEAAPEETGKSFVENSLLKARSLRALLVKRGVFSPVLADDSGLCVDCLGGRPGIYSARYGADTAEGGRKLGARERNALLLREIAAQPCDKPKTARFVCAMTCLFDDERYIIVQETLEGIIAAKESGQGGFGYDPLLFLPSKNCTVAELPESEKNKISHRAKAARKIAALLLSQ